MKGLFRGSTLLDWLLVVLLVSGAAVSSVAALQGTRAGDTVLVERAGEVIARLRLAEDGRTGVQGTRGRVIVEVQGGRVAVTSADCPNHVCIRSGWKQGAGEVIVCVPNRTVIRIVDHRDDMPQGVTG